MAEPVHYVILGQVFVYNGDLGSGVAERGVINGNGYEPYGRL